MKFIDKDLKAVQEARVLMEEAAEAKKTLALFEQKKLDRIAACMMDALELKLEQLTEEAVRETGYGDAKDQLLQAKLLIKKMRKTLEPMKCVGVLSTDEARFGNRRSNGRDRCGCTGCKPGGCGSERCRMRGKIRKRHCFCTPSQSGEDHGAYRTYPGGSGS